MVRNTIGIISLFFAMLLPTAPLEAQDRFGIEVRGSGALATQESTRETHEYGVGLDATVQYRIRPSLATYGGWNHTQFGARDAIAGPGMKIEETGFVLGLRLDRPLTEGSSATAWLRGGATYTNLELEQSDGDITDRSGHGLGWEFGAGVALPVVGSWSVTPGIRYRSMTRDFATEGVTAPVQLQQVAFEIGILRLF